ncbi:MAG: methyltransferase domain-containing protein [bacterium]
MRDGKGVDIIINAHDLKYKEEFDVIICLDTLEHDDNPFQTIKKAYQALKIGGIILITVPGINFQKHGYPSDYWRFTEEGLKVLLKNFKKLKIKKIHKEIYGFAEK